jgi:RHS repeat-associated protein
MTLQLTGSGPTGSILLTQNGNIRQTFSYCGYGGTNNKCNALPGFNGERRDPVTGMTHSGNGYRAYSPALMRFTCPDNLSPFGKGGINPYVYCEADPVNNVDPSGHAIFRRILNAMDTVSESFQELAGESKSIHKKSGNIGALDAQQATSDAVISPEAAQPESSALAFSNANEATSGAAIPDRVTTPGLEGATQTKSLMPEGNVIAADNPELARRDILADTVLRHHNENSVYIEGVGFINHWLKHFKIGISEPAFESISENIRQVNFGTRTQSAASLREFTVFARDTLSFMKAGEYKNAGITATGSAINLVGGTLFFPLYDRENFSIWQRAFYNAMDFIE